jgi:C4-dicarboxylate transporter DctQ subunit
MQKSYLSKITATISHAMQVVSEISLLFLLAMIFLEVLRRYVFDSPTQYSVEFSQYLLVFLAFAPAAFCLKHNRHVRVEILVNMMSQRTQLILRVFCYLVLAVFAGVLLWYGTKISAQAFIKGERSSSLISFPMWIPYGFIPLSSLALMLQALALAVQTFCTVRGGINEKASNGSE